MSPSTWPTPSSASMNPAMLGERTQLQRSQCDDRRGCAVADLVDHRRQEDRRRDRPQGRGSGRLGPIAMQVRHTGRWVHSDDVRESLGEAMTCPFCTVRRDLTTQRPLTSR